MQEIVLLHITGEDRPGLTSALSSILAAHGIRIFDMNQTVIHRTLLMGMLVQIPPSSESTALLQDLSNVNHCSS